MSDGKRCIMAQTVRNRECFAAILRRRYALYKEGCQDYYAFLYDLAEAAPAPGNWGNVEDPSLRVAWAFVDTFSDAMEHGLPVLDAESRELTLLECEQLLEHIIERFSDGLEVTLPSLLAFAGFAEQPAAVAPAARRCAARVRAFAGRIARVTRHWWRP
jgi:hypothetical protein